MKKIVNNPHLTAIERTSMSFPTRWLKQNNLLKGEILDFGCGFGFDADQLKEQGFEIVGYDNYYHPDYPQKCFDTIICNYVLNVLEPNEQAEVLMSVSELLKPTGKAYFAVRRDLKAKVSERITFTNSPHIKATLFFLTKAYFLTRIAKFTNINIITK
jgi:2-polyprenyl-3-methyl-5-hydroxy-6-metoxy-1,4-benzoquinol methylase